MNINLQDLKKTKRKNFCVVLRHDLDDVDLTDLKENNLLLKTFDISSLFLLPSTFNQIDKNFKDKIGSREIGLHSDFVKKYVPILPNGYYHRFLIRTSVKRQFKSLQKISNTKIFGHAPHSESNYWMFRTENACWNIIQASLNVDNLVYYSDWAIPKMTVGGSFNRNLPHSHHKIFNLNVFSTCWDDKSLFPPIHKSYLNSFDESKNSWDTLIFCLNHYKKINAPAIFNFHPIYFRNPKIYDIYQKFILYCERQRYDIVRFMDLC